MNESLFRELLYEREGPRLDFKREQYAFKRGTDHDKSKLLKDLLTLANSWRSTAAYILVGVAEDSGKAGELLGIAASDHIDEAILQQFVQSKLNRPLEFTYYPFTHVGKTFGVFEIPNQQRPFYATRDFGLVKRGEVYFRRGSSCEIANPECLYQMGQDDAVQKANPRVQIAFADSQSRRNLGTKVELNTKLTMPHKKEDFPEEPEASTFARLIRRDNPAFWLEFADYLRDHYRFSPLGFEVFNAGERAAEEVRVELRLPLADEVELRRGHEIPQEPSKEYEVVGVPNVRTNFPMIGGVTLDIERIDTEWVVKFDLGLVRPKETIWTDEPLFIAPPRSGRYTFSGRIYASNIGNPVGFSLSIQANVVERPSISYEALESFWNRYCTEQADEAGDANEPTR